MQLCSFYCNLMETNVCRFDYVCMYMLFSSSRSFDEKLTSKHDVQLNLFCYFLTQKHKSIQIITFYQFSKISLNFSFRQSMNTFSSHTSNLMHLFDPVNCLTQKHKRLFQVFQIDGNKKMCVQYPVNQKQNKTINV